MTKVSYGNPWHKPGRPEYGPEFYQTDANPSEYRGYLIYHRTMSVWDVVDNGVCVTQRAGINGARSAIDKIHINAAQFSVTHSKPE